MTLRPAVGDAEIANSTVRCSINFGPGEGFDEVRGVAAGAGLVPVAVPECETR